MKLPWILFALLLSMCVLMGYLFTIEETTGGHGFVHPVFKTMERGGDGLERHAAPVIWCAWFLGVFEVSFFVGLIALGLRHKERVRERKWPLLIGAILYAAVFTLILLAYHRYANSTSRPLFLSFPSPSAWMVYGLWPVPLYFQMLYVLFFDRWILREEDLQRFRQIVAARREQRAE